MDDVDRTRHRIKERIEQELLLQKEFFLDTWNSVAIPRIYRGRRHYKYAYMGTERLILHLSEPVNVAYEANFKVSVKKDDEDDEFWITNIVAIEVTSYAIADMHHTVTYRNGHFPSTRFANLVGIVDK